MGRQGDGRVPEPAGRRQWGTDSAGPALLVAADQGEQGEKGDVSGLRDGVSVTVRDGDFWKRTDLAGALAEATLDSRFS